VGVEAVSTFSTSSCRAEATEVWSSERDKAVLSSVPSSTTLVILPDGPRQEVIPSVEKEDSISVAEFPMPIACEWVL